MGNCFSGNKKSDYDPSSIYTRPSVSTHHTNRELTSSNLSSHQRSIHSSQNPLNLQTQDNEILKRYLSNLSTVSKSIPKPQSNVSQINLSTQVANRKLALSYLGRDQTSTQNSQNLLNLPTQDNRVLKRNLSTVSDSIAQPHNYGQINLSIQDTNQKLTLSNLGRDQRSIQSPQNPLNLQTQNNQILKRNLSNLSTVSDSKPKPHSNVGQINLSTQNTNRKLILSNLGQDQKSIQSSQNSLNLQTKNNQISKNRYSLNASTTANSKPKSQHCVNQRNLSSKNSSKLQTKTSCASRNSVFSSDEPRAQEEKSKRSDQFRQKPNSQPKERQLSPPILRLLKLVYNENSVILDDQKIAFHYYRNLKTKLNLLKPHEPAYPKICNYLKNTHGPTHNFKLSIVNIYSTYRWGVFHDFKINKKLVGNLKLLWHGSELSNFPSILSNGLLTKPPSHVKTTGKMFGNGIYFADVVTKAAQYCKVDRSNPYGILILAQVALGEEYIRTKSDYIISLPSGKNSVKALGRYQPNDSESIRMFGMEIPIGKPTLKHYLNTSLQYNEYIVYDINQIFIEYLVLVKFNY